MKNTRNIHRLGRQAGLVTALALSGLLLGGASRGNAQYYSLELLRDPSFELQPGPYLQPPWYESGNDLYGGYVRVQTGSGTGYSGTKNALIVQPQGAGYMSIRQVITGLKPLARYQFCGYVKCSANVKDAYLGACYTSGTVIKKAICGVSSTPQYKWVTVDFTMGWDTTVTVFAELYGTATGTGTMQIDGLSFRELTFPTDLVDDPSFENQTCVYPIKAPWGAEGPTLNGVKQISTVGAAAGVKSLRIVPRLYGWNAITQRIATQAGTLYVASAKIRTSSTLFTSGVLRIKNGCGITVGQAYFGRSASGYATVKCYFTGSVGNPVDQEDPMMTLSIGYTGGSGSWLQIDDVHVLQCY